jgi:hypothetical protein
MGIIRKSSWCTTRARIKRELGDIIPTAAPVLDNKKERPHLPPHFVLQTPSQTDQTMASIRGQDNPIFGPQ